MATTEAPIDKLKSFLNELFQFESQDLDFGVYKILHYKRKEIKKFIDELLVEKVTKEFETLTAEEKKKLQQQLDDLKQEQSIKNWLEAKEANDENRINFYERDFKEDIAKYKRLEQRLYSVYVSEETQNQIYNHLYQFFSRYYDKGDFISKRRFGKNEKYMVPYNGEETHFYWANHDQYYIKSSETFHQFSFKIPIASGNLSVRFKLTEAQVEQGNVKNEDTNYFLLSDKEPEINQQEAVFFFEYRPLTDAEKKEVKSNNKQEDLNNKAYETIKENHKNNSLLAELWDHETQNDEKPRLLKKLNHYTRKNNYDFFIHKDLKGFLQRELDFYIKSEMVNVDDLYVTEADRHFETLRNNLKEIKVFKNIAETIIDFVSQIEEFQKKLWEKKKFVIQTEWVITTDKLVEYVGEEAAKSVLEKVIQNDEQISEWKNLFGEEVFDDWDDITIEALCIERKEAQQEMDFNEEKSEKIWKKLPVDTVHFQSDFKERLLALLSDNIELEKEADGLVIHTDNYHGLNIISDSHKNLFDCAYIDPPYNTEADRSTGKFIYKDGYSESTWLSFLDERINNSQNLLNDLNGCIYSSIDDNEVASLKFLFENYYGSDNLLANIIWAHGRTSSSHYTQAHEYILGYAKDKNNKPFFIYDGNEVISDRAVKRPGSKNPATEIQFPKGMDFESEDKVFPDEFGQEEPIIVVKGKLECKNRKLNKDVTLKAGWTMKDMIQQWIDGEEVIDSKGQKINRFFFKNNGVLQYKKVKRTIHPKTIVEGKTTKKGTISLRNLFGYLPFDFPKPPELIYDIIKHNLTKKQSLIIDFFPGSGTTFHSTQLANRADLLKRKCFLMDQGEYVYSVINPRIKKIAYTYDWKEGKPKDNSMNGLGVFFKYQRLEQYEEAFENISFNQDEKTVQQAMEFEDYIPKYFLEFETKGSPTLVNTELMKDPWNYQLRIWDGYTYDTEKAIDLVETFNYLIGLHMEKIFTKTFNNTKYKFIYGRDNDATKILVIWRKVKDWSIDDFKKDREVLQQEMAKYEYDTVYINDQAHIDNYKRIENVFNNKMQS